MRTKRKANCIQAVLLTSLLLAFSSCATTKNNTVIEIPDITFPVFPDPAPAVFDEKTNTVSMPLDYWLLITEYKDDVDRVQTYLDRLRKEVKEDVQQ